MNRKRFWKWFRAIVIIYFTGGIFLYFFQEKLMFHPVSLPIDYQYSFAIPFREINLELDAKKNLNIVQFIVPPTLCKGVVLYFHGNMENISLYAGNAINFTRHGYEVWMMDYPGFGKTTGKRTEKNLYADALEFYNLARLRFPPDSIIIYGKSIGTGIACQLASIRNCRRLILETPFYSTDALAKHYFPIYPVMLLTKFSFPNYQYVEKINAPISIFHGTADEVIPYKQSERLMKVIRRGELITIERGKHNNLNDFPVFHRKLDSLLEE